MRVRKQKGFSQDRLTLESRLSRGTVSRIERGLVDPRASTLAEIAVTLGVPLPELMSVSLEDTSAL